MFGFTLCLCLVAISHVAAQGFFPEGMDPYAQQRQMGMEMIDAQMEAAEGLPPMQQKRYMQQLNRQKMAISQNYGYQQHYQRGGANGAVYPTQTKPNNVLIQAPYGGAKVQNTGYQAPYFMQQYPQAFNGLRSKPQTNVYVIDTQQTRQNPSVPQKAASVPIQISQQNLMPRVPNTRPFHVMLPQASRFMPSYAQLPQIIIVSQGKPGDAKNSLTSQPTLQFVTPQPTQNKSFFGQNSNAVITGAKSDQNFGTTMKPEVTTPSASAFLTTPKAPGAAQKMDLIKTPNFLNVNQKNVNIHQVIDDALKEHIKKKQQALEATLQSQLLAKQQTLEAALKAQIINKHKTLEAALNAEILTKHQSSEAALKEQILKKQKTLEARLKAQMVAKHNALEAAMEAFTNKNAPAAQAVNTSVMAKNTKTQNTKNELNTPSDSRATEIITRSNSRTIKQGVHELQKNGHPVSTGNVQTNIQHRHISSNLHRQQQHFGQSQFRPRIVSENHGFINNGGVNILPHLSRGHRHTQTITRVNISSENKKIQNPVYEQPTTASLVQITVEPTTVQTITSTSKPEVIQVIQTSKVVENKSEPIQQSQNQQPPTANNGDMNASRKIPKLMIKLSSNESGQRSLLQNMKSADRKRLVNYFLRRIVRQPQRDSSSIIRTATA